MEMEISLDEVYEYVEAIIESEDTDMDVDISEGTAFVWVDGEKFESLEKRFSDLKSKVGYTDISELNNGTVTGAISFLNYLINELSAILGDSNALTAHLFNGQSIKMYGEVWPDINVCGFNLPLPCSPDNVKIEKLLMHDGTNIDNYSDIQVEDGILFVTSDVFSAYRGTMAQIQCKLEWNA